VTGPVYATTKNDSWNRAVGMIYMSTITYPCASSIATGTGAEKAIRRTTPEHFRVYSGAFPVAMLATLGIQAVSVGLTIATERPIFMVGVLASTFIGGSAGANKHIRTTNQYADDWDNGAEY